MKERLSRVEDIMKNRTSVSNKNDNLIRHLLPLNTIGSIQDFDSFLRNTDEAVKQFKNFLLRIGGNNPRDNIQCILPKILTDKCAMKCFWKGEITLHHSNLTEAEFDGIVAEWLRFAKQRNERVQKQAHEDNNSEEDN